jgi:hypothetical protein
MPVSCQIKLSHFEDDGGISAEAGSHDDTDDVRANADGTDDTSVTPT